MNTLDCQKREMNSLRNFPLPNMRTLLRNGKAYWLSSSIEYADNNYLTLKPHQGDFFICSPNFCRTLLSLTDRARKNDFLVPRNRFCGGGMVQKIL